MLTTKEAIYKDIIRIREEQDQLMEKQRSDEITQEEFRQEWGRLGKDVLFLRRQLNEIANTNN